jgi:hypothetical protein
VPTVTVPGPLRPATHRRLTVGWKALTRPTSTLVDGTGPSSRSGASGEPEGKATALVAVVGNEDDGRDIILPGAARLDRWPKIVWDHDLSQPIAKVLAADEWADDDPRLPDDLRAKGLGAVVFDVQFDLRKDATGAWMNPRSVQAWADVSFHDDIGWSIGYTVDQFEYDKAGRRLLKAITLWEASPVTHGMNREARTVELKGRRRPDDAEHKVYVPGAFPGSWQETMQLLDSAIEAWAVDTYGERRYSDDEGERNVWWAYMLATMSDSVLWSVEADGEVAYFRATWAPEGNGGVALGPPEQVELQISVTPDDDQEDADVDMDEAITVLADTKAGRVLSATNLAHARSARDALDALIAAAEAAEAKDDEGKGGADQEEAPAVDGIIIKGLTGEGLQPDIALAMMARAEARQVVADAV